MAKKRSQARARKAEVRALKGQKLALGSPPELVGLEDLPEYCDLTCTDAQRESFAAAASELSVAEGVAASEFRLGCVVRLDRGYPAVITDAGVLRCEHATFFAKGDHMKPAVGDWVCLRVPDGHDCGVIERVLPRKSDVARWRGGSRGEKQTLAANVDIVLVACALGARTDVNRIARSRVIALDCGVDVAVVLTKCDRTRDLSLDVSLLREALGDAVPIVATAAGSDGSPELESEAHRCGVPFGIDAVRELVPCKSVAMVLGESGAGKSTLLNALLGHELLETGGVREKDDAGRHTTVTRRMVAIPSAGTIVDEPGLRTLPLVGHERGLSLAFPEIAEAARSCRFSDCTHEHEPDCGLVAAESSGEVSSVRGAIWRSLASEMRRHAGNLDPDIVL